MKNYRDGKNHLTFIIKYFRGFYHLWIRPKMLSVEILPPEIAFIEHYAKLSVSPNIYF